jgi:hypothetical protein
METITMFMKKIVVAAAAVCAMLSAGSAMAANWPATVVGTWSALANQSLLTLTITSMAGTGTGSCRQILGTLADNAAGGQSNTIQGFYCFETGRIQFLRKNTTTNDTFQVYTGSLSIVGTNLYMAGTFAEDNQIPNLGEYNFFAELSAARG